MIEKIKIDLSKEIRCPQCHNFVVEVKDGKCKCSICGMEWENG